MPLRTYSNAELRALEYWERGHGRQTKLRKRLMRELRRRKCLPWREYMTNTFYGQVPGIKGAHAALRSEDCGGIVRGNARPSRGMNG